VRLLLIIGEWSSVLHLVPHVQSRRELGLATCREHRWRQIREHLLAQLGAALARRVQHDNSICGRAVLSVVLGRFHSRRVVLSVAPRSIAIIILDTPEARVLVSVLALGIVVCAASRAPSQPGQRPLVITAVGRAVVVVVALERLQRFSRGGTCERTQPRRRRGLQLGV